MNPEAPGRQREPQARLYHGRARSCAAVHGGQRGVEGGTGRVGGRQLTPRQTRCRGEFCGECRGERECPQSRDESRGIIFAENARVLRPLLTGLRPLPTDTSRKRAIVRVPRPTQPPLSGPGRGAQSGGPGAGTGCPRRPRTGSLCSPSLITALLSNTGRPPRPPAPRQSVICYQPQSCLRGRLKHLNLVCASPDERE